MPEKDDPRPGGRPRHYPFGRCTRASEGMTRREFVRAAALGAAGLALGPRLMFSPEARAAARAAAGGRGPKIVRAFHPEATTGWTTVNQEPVDEMVHAAVRELTGIGDTGAAWKSLFPGITAAKKVAIKINLACGDVPTHPEVVNAIVDGLLMMDLDGETLPPENIIVHDLDNAFFCAQTGYTQNWGGPGVQYVGTDHPSVGFDTGRSYPIYHPHDSVTQHHLSRIIGQFCDYVVNAAVIKDHSDSGVTMCLKNHYGSYDNVSVNQLHTHWYYGDGHTRGEPELNRVLRDEVGGKTKLFLIDGTFGLFQGGPGYVPPYHTPPNWAYNSVLVGFDPVAIDRIGTVKINEERAKYGLAALNPSHVSAAAGEPYNLGENDPSRIDLVEIDASLLDVEDEPGPPEGAVLLAPYPNPARDHCTVRFRAGAASRPEVVIVDVRGRLVRRLASGPCESGLRHLTWDGRDESGRAVPSGVYFCRLTAGGRASNRRIVVVR